MGLIQSIWLWFTASSGDGQPYVSLVWTPPRCQVIEAQFSGAIPPCCATGGRGSCEARNMLTPVARLSVRALLAGLLAAVASGEQFPPRPLFAGAPKQALAHQAGQMGCSFCGLTVPNPQLA